MIKIKNVKVNGMAFSIAASALPKMVETYDSVQFIETVSNIKKAIDKRDLNNNHIKRAIRLGSCKSGEGHDCYLKGITVAILIDYPVYWSPQLQRYHFIDFISSSSSMHTILKQDFRKAFPRVPEVIIQELEKARARYNEAEKPEDKKQAFYDLMEILPQGQIKQGALITNYLQLKTIYKQRKEHQLKQDWGILCEIIEKLPLFKELCNLK